MTKRKVVQPDLIDLLLADYQKPELWTSPALVDTLIMSTLKRGESNEWN
jgi:hypothetical protein